MKKYSCIFTILLFTSFTNLISQNLNISIETVAPTIMISPGSMINVNVVLTGQPPANCNVNENYDLGLTHQFEIYDPILATVIYTTPIVNYVLFSGRYCPIQGLFVWESAPPFEIINVPCNLLMDGGKTYEIRCKTIVITTTNWSPPATFQLGNTFFGTSCPIISPPSCSFKIGNAIATGITPLITLSPTSTNETCPGNNDGTATANTAGGLSPLTYQWDDPSAQITQTATGLAAGVYNVIVTDFLGCSVNTTVTVGGDFSATVIATDESCPGFGDGSATANVSIGSGSYSYLWTPGGSTASSITGLTPGNYSCTITDLGTGCTVTLSDNVYSANYTDPNGVVVAIDETWSTNRKINGIVLIKNGATLTIDNGAVIEFGPQGEIKNDNASSGGPLFIPSEEPLIVNNATLTGLIGCPDNRWKGINVTGKVTLTNAIIENADNALQLRGRFDLDNGTIIFGGELMVTSSTFTNNQQGITVFSDVQNSVSIELSTFQNLAIPVKPISFTNQVTFLTMRSSTIFSVTNNNTFSNNGVFNFPNKPIAIDYFPISGGPQGPGFLINNNTFTDLQEGIIARNSRLLFIEGNAFSANDKGVTLIGSLLGEISTNNTFTIADAINVGADTYGVRLIGTTGTIVRDNSFTGTGGNAAQSYGVIVENTGAGGSTLFNNNFEGTDIGVQTQGDNPAFKIRCNTFENNAAQHNIAAWTTLVDPLAPANSLFKQGLDCTPPNAINEDQAGNEWLVNCPGAATTDMVVDPSITFQYRAHEFNAGLASTTDPQCSSSGWLGLPPATGLDICSGVNKTINSCNDPFAGIIADPDNDFEGYVTEVKALITTYKNEIVALQSLIDGGSTLNLLSIIATQSNGIVKNALLSASPYLSDQVIIAYLNNNSPAGHIKQVVIANSPVTSDVMQTLNSISLPKGIRNQINAAQTGISARQVLEQDINGFNGEIQLLINDLQRRINQIPDKPREKQLLIEQNDLESQKKLTDILINEGDLTGAQVIINDIMQDPLLMSTDENQQFCDLANCIIGMVNQNRTIYELTAAETQIVEDVAHSATKIANSAQAILIETTGEITNYPIAKIPNGNNLRLTTESSSSTIQTSSLKIYPNPSTGLISIEYDELIYGELYVEIYNMLGKKVSNDVINSRTLNLSHLQNGIYIVNFIDANNQIIDYQKLTIQR